MTTILETSGLSKSFRHPWNLRQVPVLNGLDLQVQTGEIFGLIGPNGAGKTTTFKLILGLLSPTRGEVRFEGNPLQPANRAAIGFLPEQPYFYDHLTVRETLDFYASLCGIPGEERRRRIAELLDETDLAPKERAPLRTLSKGNLQRVGIAQALINRPRLLILDEPMSGLDPTGRRKMRELILSRRRDGTTILFSSHILPDAEAVCDRVGIIRHGQLREVVGTHRDVPPVAHLLSFRGVDPATLTAMEKIAGCAPVAEGASWTLRVPGDSEVRLAVDAVHRANGVLESLTPVRPSLEERFLSHVGSDSDLD